MRWLNNFLSKLENVFFLDADIFPLENDWAQRISNSLDKANFLHGYSTLFYLTKEKTKNALLNPEHQFSHHDLINDSTLGYHNRNLHTATQSIAVSSFGYGKYLVEKQAGTSGGCIAFHREFLDSIGGLPYQEIFGGLNDVLLLYQLSLCNENAMTIFPNSLLEFFTQKRKSLIGYKFIGRRLYHLYHKPGAERDYGGRVQLSVDEKYDPETDIYLNTSGGIEFTQKGARLENTLRKIREKALVPEPALLS